MDFEFIRSVETIFCEINYNSKLANNAPNQVFSVKKKTKFCTFRTIYVFNNFEYSLLFHSKFIICGPKRNALRHTLLHCHSMWYFERRAIFLGVTIPVFDCKVALLMCARVTEKIRAIFLISANTRIFSMERQSQLALCGALNRMIEWTSYIFYWINCLRNTID